jgi:hypothetical protein
MPPTGYRLRRRLLRVVTPVPTFRGRALGQDAATAVEQSRLILGGTGLSQKPIERTDSSLLADSRLSRPAESGQMLPVVRCSKLPTNRDLPQLTMLGESAGE